MLVCWDMTCKLVRRSVKQKQQREQFQTDLVTIWQMYLSLGGGKCQRHSSNLQPRVVVKGSARGRMGVTAVTATPSSDSGLSPAAQFADLTPHEQLPLSAAWPPVALGSGIRSGTKTGSAAA